MFGFVIGALCLYGLVRVLRGGRRCGGARGRGHRRGGWGRHSRRPWLHWLFDRLDTSPGQEKAIRAALADLETEASALRGALGEARTAARAAVGEAVFDEAPLDALFEAHDDALVRLRVSFKETLRTVHETLDDEQRGELARLLRRFGPLRGFGPMSGHGEHHVFTGPYR